MTASAVPDPPVPRPPGSLPPARGIQLQSDLGIPLADGTWLSGDLYLPDGHVPGPVLVSYYPYRTDDIIGSLFEHTRMVLGQRGYPTLFVDMAGTGASEGSYGESFDLPREGRDCAEIIEWAARQDWCDGTVGRLGGLLRRDDLPGRRGGPATAPAGDRRGLRHHGHVSRHHRAWGQPGHAGPLRLGCAHGGPRPVPADPPGPRRPLGADLAAADERLGTGQPHALAWQAHPDRDDYWQARVVDASAIDVPTMLIGGWADAYADAILRTHAQVGGPKRLIMGPWMHVLPHLSAVPAPRLGRRDGGLVGHPPTAGGAPH